MTPCVYVLCVKGFFGWVKPFAYFRNKKSAEKELVKYKERHRFKHYCVQTVHESMADKPELQHMIVGNIYCM